MSVTKETIAFKYFKMSEPFPVHYSSSLYDGMVCCFSTATIIVYVMHYNEPLL